MTTTPQPHVYADKIIQFANDPTQDVWYKVPGGRWQIWESSVFPSFEKTWEWHVGHEPPQEPEVMEFTFKGKAPWRVEPPMDTEYWILDSAGNVHDVVWVRSPLDLRRLDGGLCWHAEADAIAYRDAYRAAALGEGKP